METTVGRNRMVLILVGIAAALLVIVLIVRAFSSSAAEFPMVNPVTGEQPVVAYRQQERLVVATAAVQATKQEADRVVRGIDALAREVSLWKQKVEPLIVNGTGRRIAANRQYTLAFAQLWEQKRATPDDVQSYRDRLNTIVSHLEKALSSPLGRAEPTDPLRDKLAAIRKEVDLDVTEYAVARKTVDAMVAAVKGGAPADCPLGEAMEHADENFLAERLRELADEREKSERQTTRELLEVQRRKNAEIREAKKKQTEAILEAERKQIETQTVMQIAAAERERLFALAQTEATQAKFAPFLARGSFYTERNEPGPMSAGVIVSAGVPANFDRFVDYATTSQNDRPRWSQPSGPDDPRWQQYREDWELFKELMPIWMELRMLNP